MTLSTFAEAMNNVLTSSADEDVIANVATALQSAELRTVCVNGPPFSTATEHSPTRKRILKCFRKRRFFLVYVPTARNAHNTCQPCSVQMCEDWNLGGLRTLLISKASNVRLRGLSSHPHLYLLERCCGHDRFHKLLHKEPNSVKVRTEIVCFSSFHKGD